MKIYLAGNTILPKRERALADLYQARLASYFFVCPGRIEDKAFQVILEKMNADISSRRSNSN